MNPITLDEIEALAKEKLPRHIYDLYASGSDDQRALARNRDAFKRYVTHKTSCFKSKLLFLIFL